MSPDRTNRGDGAPSVPVVPIGVGVLTVAAVFLRWWKLGHQGLWVDEAYTALIANRSFAGIRTALQVDDAPPLFYVFEKPMLAIFGNSEAAVRLFPALCGSLALLATFVIFRRYAPRATSAALLVTGFSSLAIFYSQQARSYSLLHLLSVLSVWTVLRWSDRPTPARALAVVTIALALLYTHNLGVWAVLAASLTALGGWWALGKERGAAKSGLVTLLGAFALGALPWGWNVLQQIGTHRDLNDWMATWWRDHPLALAPLFSTAVFLNGGLGAIRPPVPAPVIDPTNTAIAAVCLVLRVAVAAFAVSGIFRALRPTDRIGRILTIYSAVPLLGLLLTHVGVGPSYVVGRTDTIALFPFLLLVGYGWSKLSRPLRTAALSIWVLVCLLPYAPGVGRSVEKGADRALAQWLGEHIEPGDALVVAMVGRPTLEYYAERQGWLDRLGSFSTFPPVGDENPAAVFPTPLDSVDTYRSQARAIRAAWERTGVSTVWCEGVLLNLEPGFPSMATVPPPDGRFIDANALGYPGSILVYTLLGLEPAPVSARFRRDWMGADRVLLAIPRTRWIPVDSLPPVEATTP